jgi:hypothetical protein
MHETSDERQRAAIAVVAVFSMIGCSVSGAPEPAQPAPASARYVMEQATQDRWISARQRPEFTPFARASSTLYLDLAAPDPRTGERTIRVAFRAPRSADSAALQVRPDGRVVRYDGWVPSVPLPPMIVPGDSARFARIRLRLGGRLALPQTRVWELVPRVRPRRFVAGARWTDTLALDAAQDGFRQTLAGVRTSVLIGDTVVAGRRLWIVRDSAVVRYAERDLEHERTLDTLVAIDRTVTGTVLGRYVYDPDLRFSHLRNDTTSLSGDAVLRYPDGRTFATPVRYERTRHWTLYDIATFTTRQAARRAELQRTSSGPVRSASNETERRLGAGDTTLRDSLTSVWASEREPNRREELYRLLMLWGRPVPAFKNELDARRMAAGDSAFILRQLAERAYPARPRIDFDAAQQMIRVMSDPGLPFAFGWSRDAIYENLVQTFSTWPPATAPDSSQWRCTPDACALLGAQWHRASEPRLRDVGLAVLATIDPVRWADTAVARAAAGSSVIQRIAQLANGVGATWPAAAKLALPAEEADWRAWLAWMNAPNPQYRVPSALPQESGIHVRFDESHATAIRFHQVRTGRDLIGELRRRLVAATDDSARMVYGTMLSGLGDTPSVDQIAAQLRSGSAPQITLARRSMHSVFGARAPRADSATTVAIIDRLIESRLDGSDPWPQLTPRPGPTRPPAPPPAVPPRYVLLDSVPPALQAKWRDRVRFISLDEWRRMPEGQPAELLTFSGVERVGPFVRVQEHVSGRLPRQPNETPRLFFSGTSYYLLATGDGWAIVDAGMWIT